MPRKVEWTSQAKSDLRAIDQINALHILQVVALYLATDKGDVKRLRDKEPPELRLRVGDYRVRFYSYSDSILVLSVQHRRAAYR